MESDDEELEVFEPNGELPQPKSRPTFTRPGVKPDERVAELEAKLKEKEEELQQLEREQLLKVKPLEEEVSRQDSELKRVRADLVDANAEKERLLSEVKIVHSATNKLADLEQAIKVKDAELQENFREASSLRSQLRKKDEEKAAALLKKDEEKATALELKDKEREAAAAASLSVQRMLEAEIKQKESQLQLGDKREAERQTVLLLQTELEQKNRQVEELTAQEQLRQKEWTLVVARLETQLELQKEQIQEMEGERQVSTATTGKLRLELQETTQRLQEVTSDATALRADLDRQTHTITSGFSEKEQQVAALEAALVEKDAELQALKSDNLEAAATLTRSNADLAVRSSELSVAQELVRERHAEVLEAQELLRESERQRAELEVRLAQVQANLDSRTGELATNLELVETNNEKLQRAEELLAETQKKLEAKEDSLVSLQVKLSTLSSGQSETLTLMEQSAQEKDATIESLREAAARDAEQLEQHSLALAEALATCKLRATEHEAVVAANKALVEDTEQLAKALAQCKQEGYEALEQAAVAQAAKAAEVVTLTAEVQRLTNLESEHCTTLGTAEADKGDLRAMLLACQADNDTLRAHAVARDREVTSLEKALAQSETRVRAHEEQLAELKEVAARGDKAAKDDADSAQTRLAQVTAALQDKEEQVSHLVEQVTSLTQELAEAGASSKIAAAEIQRLTEMEGNYNASKSSLQSQVAALRARIAELENEAVVREQDCRATREDADTNTVQALESKARVSSLEKILCERERELSVKEEEVASLNVDLRKQRQEWATSNSQLKDHLRSLQSDLDLVRAAKADLERANGSTVTALEAERARTARGLVEMEEMEATLSALRDDVADRDAKLRLLNTTLAKLQTEYDMLRDETAATCAEGRKAVLVAGGRAAALETTLNHRQAELESVRDDLDHERKNSNHMRSELQKLREALAQAGAVHDSDISALTARAKCLEGEALGKDTEIVRLRKEVELRDEEVVAAQEQCLAVGSEVTRLRAEAKESHRVCLELRQQVTVLIEQVKQRESDVEQLQQQVRGQERATQQARDECQRLRRDATNQAALLQGELSSLRKVGQRKDTDIERLRSEMERLETSARAKESECQSLRAQAERVPGLDAQAASLQAQLKQRNSEVDEATARLLHLGASQDAAAAELARVSAREKAATTRAEKIETAFASLHVAFNEASIDLDRARNEAHRHKEAMERLSQTTDALRASLATLEESKRKESQGKEEALAELQRCEFETQRLRSDLESAQDSLARCNSNLEACKSRAGKVAELEAEVTALQGLLQQRKLDSEEQHSTLLSLQAELQANREDVLHQRQRASVAVDEAQQLSATITSLTLATREAEAKAQGLAADLAHEQAERAKLSTMLEDAKRVQAAAESKLSKEKQQHQLTHSELQRRAFDLEKLRGECDTLQRGSIKAETEAGALRERANKVEMLEEEVQTLTASLKMRGRDLDAQRQVLAEKSDEIKQLRSDYAKQAAVVTDLEARCQSLATTLNATKATASEYEARARAQLEKEKSSAGRHKAQIASLQAEVAALEQRHMGAGVGKAELDAELQNKDFELARCNAELDKHKELCSSQAAQLEQVQREAQRVPGLETQVASLQDQLQLRQQDAQQHKDLLEEQAQQLRQLRHQLTDATAREEASRRRVEELHAEAEQLHATAATRTQDSEKARAQAAQWLEAAGRLKRDLESCRVEAAEATTRCAAAARARDKSQEHVLSLKVKAKRLAADLERSQAESAQRWELLMQQKSDVKSRRGLAHTPRSTAKAVQPDGSRVAPAAAPADLRDLEIDRLRTALTVAEAQVQAKRRGEGGGASPPQTPPPKTSPTPPASTPKPKLFVHFPSGRRGLGEDSAASSPTAPPISPAAFELSPGGDKGGINSIGGAAVFQTETGNLSDAKSPGGNSGQPAQGEGVPARVSAPVAHRRKRRGAPKQGHNSSPPERDDHRWAVSVKQRGSLSDRTDRASHGQGSPYTQVPSATTRGMTDAERLWAQQMRQMRANAEEEIARLRAKAGPVTVSLAPGPAPPSDRTPRKPQQAATSRASPRPHAVAPSLSRLTAAKEAGARSVQGPQGSAGVSSLATARAQARAAVAPHAFPDAAHPQHANPVQAAHPADVYDPELVELG